MEDNKKQPYNIDSGVKNIHTYVSDMADAVRQNEASVIKIALAEKEKKEQEEIYKQTETTGSSKFLYIVGGVILIVVACLFVYFVINKKEKESLELPTTNKIETIISYDDSVTIDTSNFISKKEITDSLTIETSKINNLKIIKYISLKKKNNNVYEPISSSDLISILKLNIPSPLKRSMNEDYMVGTYFNKSSNINNLFIIFSIKDYNLAYASMLEWEKLILEDTFDIFNIKLSENEYLLEKSWEDIVINNKDARVLYNRNGEGVLYYIFIDKNNLLLTKDKDAIKEINARLITKTILPI